MAHVLAFSSQRVAGESSDSDAEIDTSSGNEIKIHSAKEAVVVLGEAPESDEDDFMDAVDTTARDLGHLHVTFEDPPSPTIELIGDNGIRYNTILHRKLRDKNELLRKELISVACNPYNDATREIKSITGNLMRSQKMVQGVSSTLRRVSRDLLMLEDSLNQLKAAKSRLPQINTSYQSNSRTSSNAMPRKGNHQLDQDSFESSDPGMAEATGIKATV